MLDLITKAQLKQRTKLLSSPGGYTLRDESERELRDTISQNSLCLKPFLKDIHPLLHDEIIIIIIKTNMDINFHLNYSKGGGDLF